MVPLRLGPAVDPASVARPRKVGFPMFQTRLSRPDLDDPALAARWGALAAASGAPAFRSWAWVGCLARERYPEPVLAEVFAGERLVGMALFKPARAGVVPA